MWFPIIQHGVAVIEARHEHRWRFRRRVTRAAESGLFVSTRGEATTGLGWLLDEGGAGPLEGLHPAAPTVLRGARDYALCEQRAPWWLGEVARASKIDALALDELVDEVEELVPPRLPWNAHVVHHHEVLCAWRGRHVAELPLVDLAALVLAGTTGAEVDRAWALYIEALDLIGKGGVPGEAATVARFVVSPGAAAEASAIGCALVRDGWHWGLAVGEEDAIALPPQIGAELAWRLESCLNERHRAALAEEVVMLAIALRHVPDPREPFVVLVHGRCVVRARWRLGVWEWSATYRAASFGYWRRGDLAALLRSDLSQVGLPTYVHPAVAPALRDAFELAVRRRGAPHPDDATWRELLSWAEEGLIVDCLARGDT